jgi:8-oxo-dGTP pyrophosphatase MutT (NUDIX family)
MPAEKISLDEAKPEKLFYFVVNVVPVRKSDGRALILKRSEREIAHGGRYGVVGGKLEHADLDLTKPTRVNGDILDFEDAIPNLAKREAHEEAGINIGTELKYINQVTFLRPDGVPVVLLKFAAEYIGGKIKLEENSFSDFAWVNAEEVKNYPTIDGIAGEVAAAISLFAK